MPRRTVWVVLGVCAILVSFADVASGHAAFRDSAPKAKTTMGAPPDEVSVEFTEPVTGDSRLEVFDPCGRQVDDGDSRPRGFRITIGVAAAAAGTYQARYFVISNLDGHPTRGRFSFAVEQGEECPEAAPAATEGAQGSSLFDLPLGGVLMALGSSVLIGAAGGFVYAGIMSPIR